MCVKGLGGESSSPPRFRRDRIERFFDCRVIFFTKAIAKMP